MKSISSRDFNQDLSSAKRAAKDGPVFITDRGKPSYVLLNIAEYQSLTGGRKSLQEAFAELPKTEIVIDAEFGPANRNTARAANLDDE